MGDLIFLHEAKYKKSMEASKKEINLIVNSIANLLKIKPITYKEYKAYLSTKKLNNVYLIHDIINKEINKDKATWQILLLYYKNNITISLESRVESGKDYILGPLYIGGHLYFTSPTIHDIFSYVSSYITNTIYPELNNE